LWAKWAAKDGEHAWLEEVEGEAALSWVKEQNAKAVETIGDPSSSKLYSRVLSILDSKEKIPYVKPVCASLSTWPGLWVWVRVSGFGSGSLGLFLHQYDEADSTHTTRSSCGKCSSAFVVLRVSRVYPLLLTVCV
jgi:hypothetical protein